MNKVSLSFTVRKKIRIFFLLISFFLLTLWGSGSVVSAEEQAIGYEFIVSPSDKGQLYPDIDGNRIAWLVWQNDPAIILFDCATLNETVVCSNTYGQGGPRISGDTIVWLDYRNSETQTYNTWPDIYSYNTASMKESPVCTNPSWQGDVEISNDNIVWTDNRITYRDEHGISYSEKDIYLYNIQIKKEIPVVKQVCCSEKDISDNLVVFAAYHCTNPWTDSDVYLYDTVNSTTIPICVRPGDQSQPRIDGDKIVWKDDRNGNADIYLYDLSTKTETRITTDPSNQTSPAISGDLIVWVDTRNGNPDIFMYNIATEKEEPVCLRGGIQARPEISGNKIVWEDRRDGTSNIYLFVLGSKSLKADFIANCTIGPGPLTVQFSDASIGDSDSWLWEFGDGTFSREQNPVHTYTGNGDYHVILTIANSDDIDRVVKDYYISVVPESRGHVTIVAAGDQAYDIGEKIRLSGANTETGYTYLFITGPNLPENGAKLQDLSIGSITGTKSTFTAVSVELDNTWKYDWNTSALQGGVLEPGLYTIFAVAETKNYANLNSTVYSTVDVLFRNGEQLTPFPACINAPTDPDGDGIYEDTNGNGRKDFNDIVVFFKHMTWVSQNEPVECFDFNGNGRIDFNDVVMMFKEM